MDEIYGVSLDRLAELGAKYSEFSAKFAEKEARAAFEQWLVAEGTDSHTYWLAYNGWHERFTADPTGLLYARFTTKAGELSQKVHFGDVRDMSQDTQEGVTLDRYAELTVAMGKPGIDAEAVARQHGLTDAAHWLRVNAAWSQAMSQDLQHKLTTQFGQLYQKYAGPAFAEQTLQATAALLAESNQPRDKVSEPEVSETPDTLLQKLSSASRAERWRAARMLAHLIDIGAAKGTAYRAACVPVLIELLEQHDEHTSSDAEDAARRLMDLGERTSDVKGSMQRCLARAQDKLVALKAAFAPIADQSVPERIPLQTRIQSYTSLVLALKGYLADFQETPVASAAMLSSRSGASKSGGLGFALPLVVVLVLVGGGLAFWFTRKSAPDATLNAATTAAESAAVAPTAAAVDTPAPATAAAQGAASAAPAGKAAHGAKHHPKKIP